MKIINLISKTLFQLILATVLPYVYLKYVRIMGCGASNTEILEDDSIRGSEHALATETSLNGLKVVILIFFFL